MRGVAEGNDVCSVTSGARRRRFPDFEAAVGHCQTLFFGQVCMETHLISRVLTAALLVAWLCIVVCRSRAVFITSSTVAVAILAANYNSRAWLEQPFEVHFFFGLALCAELAGGRSGD